MPDFLEKKLEEGAAKHGYAERDQERAKQGLRIDAPQEDTQEQDGQRGQQQVGEFVALLQRLQLGQGGGLGFGGDGELGLGDLAQSVTLDLGRTAAADR